MHVVAMSTMLVLHCAGAGALSHASLKCRSTKEEEENMRGHQRTPLQWTPSLAGQQPSAVLLHLTTGVYRLSACTTVHMVVLVHVLIKYTSQRALIQYYYY